jgi:hypothetical protein
VTKRIYVAGPMRGYPKFNFPAFDEARDRGLALGHFIISPADIDREADPDAENMDPASITPEMCRKYAERDLDAILTCDAIAVLKGWEKSVGATAEVAVARWLKLPVLDATTFEPLAERGETVLEEAQRLVYGDRGLDYGHPLDECCRIASLWSIILKAKVKPEQVPLCMVAMKISREMNRRKRDNAVDIAGYAECLNRIHEERDRRATIEKEAS